MGSGSSCGEKARIRRKSFLSCPIPFNFHCIREWLTEGFCFAPSRAMKRDVKAVAEWDFERIIMCHGVRIPE